MNARIMRRIENRQERKIIMEFAKTRGWDYDEDLIENLCEAYEAYEDYREWFLTMVA